MSPIAIRPARPEDARALGGMGATLARLHHRMDPRRFFARRGMEAGYAAWLAREARTRKAIVLAAVSLARGRERLVGYAYGRLEGRDWNTLRDRAGVGIDLYVVPAARRRGTGRLLLEALVRELVRRGAPRVVIQVAARNARALALFEGMGFRRTVVELAVEADAQAAAPRRERPSARPRGGPQAARPRRRAVGG
jgi:ribosomal protein S18 acetylase RimI-like enzyme